jgi:hypothetical protein
MLFHIHGQVESQLPIVKGQRLSPIRCGSAYRHARRSYHTEYYGGVPNRALTATHFFLYLSISYKTHLSSLHHYSVSLGIIFAPSVYSRAHMAWNRPPSSLVMAHHLFTHGSNTSYEASRVLGGIGTYFPTYPLSQTSSLS